MFGPRSCPSLLLQAMCPRKAVACARPATVAVAVLLLSSCSKQEAQVEKVHKANAVQQLVAQARSVSDLIDARPSSGYLVFPGTTYIHVLFYGLDTPPDQETIISALGPDLTEGMKDGIVLEFYAKSMVRKNGSFHGVSTEHRLRMVKVTSDSAEDIPRAEWATFDTW